MIREDAEVPRQQFGTMIGGIGPNNGYQGQIFGGTADIATPPGAPSRRAPACHTAVGRTARGAAGRPLGPLGDVP